MAVFKAEFNVDRPYFLNVLDIPAVMAFMEYREKHPAAGALLKALLESFAGSASDNGGESMTAPDPEEFDELMRRQEQDPTALERFMKDFGDVGGTVN